MIDIKVGKEVYYVQKNWRRVVSGQLINGDNENIVMLVEDKYVWIITTKSTYEELGQAEIELNKFIDEHGPLPIAGEPIYD